MGDALGRLIAGELLACVVDPMGAAAADQRLGRPLRSHRGDRASRPRARLHPVAHHAAAGRRAQGRALAGRHPHRYETDGKPGSRRDRRLDRGQGRPAGRQTYPWRSATAAARRGVSIRPTAFSVTSASRRSAPSTARARQSAARVLRHLAGSRRWTSRRSSPRSQPLITRIPKSRRTTLRNRGFDRIPRIGWFSTRLPQRTGRNLAHVLQFWLFNLCAPRGRPRCAVKSSPIG
jgi:hypothetical protein